MATLIVYAAPREGEPVVGKHPDTLALGVGKIEACLRLTLALARARFDAVVLIGVCGAYPARHLRAGLVGLAVGELCVVASEWLADEGVVVPDGFLDLAALGFGEAQPQASDATLTATLAAALGCPIVAGATVSAGAGVEALSQAYATRSGAQVESMEGAAVARVCREFAVPFAQLRAVSNLTGDRGQGGWDLDRALARLGGAVERLLAAGVLP